MTSLLVRTAARLHWGLFRPAGDPGATLFGGVGLMVTEPKTVIRASRVMSPAECPERLKLVRDRLGGESIRIQREAAPPEHAGFGSGTQSALAVAWAVSKLSGLSENFNSLMGASGRGRRSGIGCHGFFHGGLLVDDGKSQADTAVAPLVDRVELPGDWRIVVVLPEEPGAWHGRREVEAFSTLPGRDDLARDLRHMAANELLPAARAGDFDALGPIVHRFNVLAGKAFAPVQGGVFASPGIAAAVGRARSLGFLGAGQSSWGPAVFALCADEDQASWLAGQFSESGHHGLWVARPANGGATLHEEPLNRW